MWGARMLNPFLQVHLSVQAMFSPMGNVRGGLISVTTNFMACLCHGGRNPMPGNGQLARINLAGMFPDHPESGLL
jgi:hypothetical protein